MIHTHSLGRAARYYPERTALASGGARSTFRELHDRVASMAAALSKYGFGVGDRLAILLPNDPEYIELVYACACLGVIAVPLNARFSAARCVRLKQRHAILSSAVEARPCNHHCRTELAPFLTVSYLSIASTLVCYSIAAKSLQWRNGCGRGTFSTGRTTPGSCS